MESLVYYKPIVIALALTFLIGLEREHKGIRNAEDHFGGIRTFPLIGLLGALAYMLADKSAVISGLIGAGVVGIIVSSYWASVRQDKKAIGVTTEMAAFLSFVLGVLSAMEAYVLATGLTLVTLVILHFKNILHQIAQNMKDADIIATIKFILIAFIILPLLPNESFGPYGFLNPYTAWLMVVLISGLSYLSYIAIKIWGAKRGIGLTGFLAGFISSTALTLSFSDQSKKHKTVINPYVIAVIVASSAMFFRIIAEVAVVSSKLLHVLYIPMLIMGLVGLGGTFYFWITEKKQSTEVNEELREVKNPFQLWPAIQFGLFFVGVSFVAQWAKAMFGDQGIYLTSLVSGIMDVDAITLSMANLHEAGEISAGLAVVAISIAAMTNTVVKGGIFLLLGARKVALRIGTVFLLMLLAGGVSLFFLNV